MKAFKILKIQPKGDSGPDGFPNFESIELGILICKQEAEAQTYTAILDSKHPKQEFGGLGLHPEFKYREIKVITDDDIELIIRETPYWERKGW